MEQFFGNDNPNPPVRVSWDALLGGPSANQLRGDRRTRSQNADQDQIERTPDRVRDRIRTLLERLDSDVLTVRQGAETEIQEVFGVRALPFLREVLRNRPTLEMRLRVEGIIGNIMGAREQHWTFRSWHPDRPLRRVAICRDGSDRITQMADVRLGEGNAELPGNVHTTIVWNGLNEITHLSLHQAEDVTGPDRRFVFPFLPPGGGSLTFRRTANGYQVTREDGGELPAHMQTARSLSINQQGIITVVWGDGTTTTLARDRPVVDFNR